MRLTVTAFWRLIFFFAFLFTAEKLVAQCGTPITTFPYQEDFENSNGSWFTGGSGQKWNWGKPEKPVIDAAGGGINCWIAGELDRSGYSGGGSWLQSPCFNFSALKFPYISFKIFWETERLYDGANLQFSLDQGSTWSDLGTILDPVNCLNGNWYNVYPVTYLSPFTSQREGWSGNIQSTSGSCQGGGGSGAWVTAQHTMPALAGKANVIFRFTFGAGTQCNNFDGLGIDDINISEAPSNSADFTYACSGNNAVGFTSTSALCPSTYAWNFGDATSGTSNTSASQNPVHTFSASGSYLVTLTVSGPGNEPSTITKTVSVTGITTSVVTPIKCSGDDNGILTVSVDNASGPFDYSWNTNPVQTTATATGLKAGTYTVTVSGTNICAVTTSVIFGEPAPLAHSVSIKQPCNAATGAATITESGGTAPYTYSWSPSGGNGATATNLAVGNYIVTITDNNGCTDIIPIALIAADPPVATIAGKTDVSCKDGSNGTASVSVIGGTAPFTYSWNTVPVQSTIAVNNLKAGNYNVTVEDNNGCTSTAPVQITEPEGTTTIVQTIPATCGLSNGNILLNTTGGTPPYQYLWTPGISTTSSANNIKGGTYTVLVTDNSSCSRQSTILLNNIGDPVNVELGNETAICPGQTVTLNPGTYNSYLWQDNSIASTFTVANTGKYWVRVTNADNCSASDTIEVRPVVNCDDIFFPNSFTPNSDGKNDLFGPIGNVYAVTEYSFVIYNRWGQKVFSSNNPFEKWSGIQKGQRSGNYSYVWYAAYTFKGIQKRSKKGSVIIIK